MAERWVHFVADDGEVAGYAVTDADGEYEARLPAGPWQAWFTARSGEARVDVPSRSRFAHLGPASVNEAPLAALSGGGAATEVAFAAGRWTTGGVAVEATPDGPTQLDNALPPVGRLALSVTDGDGDPLPGIALIRHAGDAPPDSEVPDDLREALGLPDRSLHAGRLWTADGAATTALPPGDYVVQVGHSPRHERSDWLEVTVPPGGEGEVAVELAEVLPRGGWFSVDTHLHAAPSMDGRVAMEDRLIACAAAGLDVPVTTDHDRFADYAPLVDALGLRDRMLVLPGTEVTTIVRGHFNLFPVEVGPRAARNRGALVWWDRDPTTTDELVGRIRAVGTADSLLQVNHGRLTLGMMDSAGYDETTGESSRSSSFSWDFDQTEIITADDREDWIDNRDDWFSFLSLGERTVPVGASDSHDLHRACGLGRTDVLIGDGISTVADVTSDAVRDAIASGRVVVASGVTLRASLEADSGVSGPGETAEGTGGTLTVRVAGPDWVRPGVLNVWRNGVVVHTEPLEAPVDGTILEAEIQVQASEDSWFVVEVDGGEAQGHAFGGHAPYALTNAFYLDIDSAGWVAPGL